MTNAYDPGYTALAAVDLVEDKFSTTMQKLQETYETTKDSLAAIESFLTGLTPFEIYPLFNSPEFLRIALTTGELPTAPVVEFPELTIPNIDIPIPGFSYSEGTYVSDLREALKDILTDGVTNGGTGLGAAVEEAIWKRNEDRDEQARRDRLDAVAAEWAESGFELPDGVLTAQLTTVDTEYLQNRQTASRDIATKQAEIARQQSEVFLKEGNQLEATMEQKFATDQARALEAAKVEPEVILRTFEAAMKQVQVQGEIYNAIASKANAQAAIFKAQIEGYATQADIGAKEMDASVRLYDSEVKGAAAQSESSWRTDSNRIEQIKNFLALRMEGLKAISTLAAQVTAAMATSVSTTASVNAQGQYSQSESESVSVSNSTTHNFNY